MLAGQKGFSLLEMIVVLLLLGVIGLFAGFGLVSGTQSYLSSRETHSATQAALLALARIRQECVAISDVTFRSPTRIDYAAVHGNPGTTYRIFYNSNNSRLLLRVDDGAAPQNHILLENVGTYGAGQRFLTFTRDDGGSWAVSDGVERLSSIGVRVNVARPSGSDLTFVLSVNPRNNGVPNAPPPRRVPGT